MKFHSFLIKYGEIGIKGKNRYIFEDALVRQIRYALQGVDGEFLVHKCHGRVYVDCDGDYDFDETVESLQKVFGIVGICPVVRVPVAELEQLRKDVVAYVDEAYEEKNMTFKVDARRAKKSYPANSMEINCEVGEAILEAFPEMKVDVHKPELRINVEIREEDIKMDVYRASGAGGQKVNKTSSAVRLTHIPTGIVVSCQIERSQHQNREVAMRMLKSKLVEIKERENLERIEDIKGDQKEIAWGSQIRSYVFMPYTLAKDHRTGFEMGNITAVMDGDIDGFINAYLKQKSAQEAEEKAEA